MKRYAVAHISYFDNELTIVIVEADSISKAIAMHPAVGDYDIPENATLEQLKIMFFNGDAAIDCIAIP